jgi:plastocyanin
MRRAMTALAIGTLMLGSACGGGGSTKDAGSSGANKPGATVPMVFTEFKPTDFAIKAGQTLTFENENPIKHVIVEGAWKAGSDGLRTEGKDDGTFSLTVNKKGDKVEHTFDKPGTYQFFCTIHFGMNGTVVVS